MRFYGVSTKVNEEGEPVELAFIYPNDNPKIRSLSTKAFHTQKGKPLEGLFGRNKFAAGSHDSVTITEGELDALSYYQVIRSPVVSVQSSATALRDCSVDRNWLNSFERIYLAFDSDAAGREAAAAVAKLFDPAKLFQVKFSNRKDANSYLEVGEGEILATLWKNAKRYLPEEIKSSLEDFKKVLNATAKVSFPYPFKGLNDLLYGIRFGETVLITAQEKVGKTEIMHFIEHKLLTESEHNVGAIFLEEQPLRHLQALAGIQAQKPYHLPDCVGGPEEVLSRVQEVVKTDDRLYLYTHFGSNDPDTLLDTVRYLVSACGCKFILFDHLSMLVSGNAGKDDERKVLDYVSTRLEMMAKELDFALIMVMHVNDNGQTRGSRFPTKVADVTIGAFRDLQNPDPVERTTIYLRVLFNRPASTTGPACALRFNRDTYTFEEKPFDDGHPNQAAQVASNDNLPVLERPRVVA